MKKLLLFRIIIAIIIILMLLCGCAKREKNEFKETQIKLETDYVEFLSKEQFIKRGHVSVLSEYYSDASVAYLNQDGTKTLYIFAIPIRYRDNTGALVNIDTRIKNETNESLRNEGYVYTIASSDIVPHFPKNSSTGIKITGKYNYTFIPKSKNEIFAEYVEQENFINQRKPMISYKNIFEPGIDLLTYPSLLGVNVEILFKNRPINNTINFTLYADDCLVELEPCGYITMTKQTLKSDGSLTNEIVGIIQAPILKDSKGNISLFNKIQLTNVDTGIYNIAFQLDKEFFNNNKITYPVKAYSSFELRREKQPDSAVYSGNPSLNSYLSNITVLGNSEIYKQGQVYIRSTAATRLAISDDKVISAQYSIISLSGKTENETMELLSVLDDWCSLTLKWSDQITLGERTSSVNTKDAIISFDITNEFRKWCKDKSGQTEHNGVLLRAANPKEGVFDVISSNDCALFNNCTEVTLE